MSTVTQLVATIDALYPNAETTANKVIYMNLAQNDLSSFFGRIQEDKTLSTVDGQDLYTFPTGITDTSEIIMLAIHNTAKLYNALTAYSIGDIVYYADNTYTCILASTGNLPTDTTYFTVQDVNRYDYVRYYQNCADENPQLAMGYYQVVNATGVKKLCIVPTPTVTGNLIVIRYQKKLADLSASSMSAEPEFDSRYHTMLAFYAAYMICSVGASPDSYQADHFLRMYDDMYDKLWKYTNIKDSKNRKTKNDNKQWHRGHSSYAGN